MKIIITENYKNKCECGKTIKIKRYIPVPEGEDSRVVKYEKKRKKDKYLGFCTKKCGNIFYTQQ